MPTKYVYPNTITQTTGGKYRPFKDLNNIKNVNNNFAVSNGLIHGKNSTPNRPSTLTFTNFKCNLPSHAEVEKITVEYKHSKVAYNNKYINIPAPTIDIISDNNSTKKGVAPTKTATVHTRQWNYRPRLYASDLNLNSFGIRINYPTNTNSNEGYIRIYYVRLKIEYVNPDYNLSMARASTNYNNDEYHLKLTISNKNLTRNRPSVVLTAPPGFTYKSFKGDGTITQTQSRVLVWTPGLIHLGLAESTELIFDVAATGTLPYTASFSAVEQETGKTGSFTESIIEKPQDSDFDTETIDNTDYTDTTDAPNIRPKVITVDEEFNYTLQIDARTWDGVLHEIYDWGITNSKWSGTYEETYETIVDNFDLKFWSGIPAEDETLSKYDTMKYNTFIGSSWSNAPYYDTFVNFISHDCSTTIELRGDDVSYDEITLTVEARITSSYTDFTGIDVNTWKFIIRPEESDLTTPSLAVLPVNGEMVNRLGHEYSYTVQSFLQEVTSDTYVRDWYRNFRIGVFNNRIDSNCTDYIHMNTDDTSQTRTFFLPAGQSWVGYSWDLTVDNPITIVYKGTSYDLSGSVTTLINLDWNSLDIDLIRKNHDTVNLTAKIRGGIGGNQIFDVKHYVIKFKQDEYEETYETTTDTTNYNSLGNEVIFQNAEYWGACPLNVNAYESLNCEFTYNENYPLYVLITGDYNEYDTPSDIKFSEPCIIETEYFSGVEPNGKYFELIRDLVANDGSISTLELGTYENSSNHIIYELPLDEDYGTSPEYAIRGIELRGDIEQTTEMILYATLINKDGQKGTRSIVIDESTNELSIGGVGDLWNFTTPQITELEKWECHIQAQNTLTESDGTLNLGNLQLIFYIEKVESQEHVCYIEGEDLRYYGAFLQKVKIPAGLETDTSFLDIDGTDTNDPYRQNIKEKTIEIELNIDNCDLTNSTTMLRQLTQLITNNRDTYNRPIPKKLEFSHYPDVYWEYITEDAFDADLDITDYTVKVKLTIPSGTAYKKQSTTTSTVGFVQGLAAINPIITVKPTSDHLEVTESISNQKFSMDLTSDYANKIVEIDTEDRIAWLKTDEDDNEPVNISSMVDFNSDWFKLQGEYNFTGVNCIIRTVDYTERW